MRIPILRRLKVPKPASGNSGPVGLRRTALPPSGLLAKIKFRLPVIQEESGESITNHKLTSQYLSIVQEVRAH